ncbi:hypothetical protein K440DRAFT_643910 [Wilcoxina mikolae CBS 423.85]|nr:hypothetical protein K440DRAFT_643910 [Wilcoxina mikolae CBS 423.85]
MDPEKEIESSTSKTDEKVATSAAAAAVPTTTVGRAKARVTAVWVGFRKRFGIFEAVALFFGSIAIMFVAAMLAFLWVFCNQETTESSGLRPNDIWKRVILKDWTTRIITVCSALLRMCIGAQVLIVCLMLATLSLEYQLKAKHAEILTTTTKSATTGPFAISLLSFLYFVFRGSSIRVLKHVLLLLAVTLLALESGIVQFASTILLSDLKVTLLRDGGGASRAINYTFTPVWQDHGMDITLFDRPAAVDFPVFAEDIVEPRSVYNDGKSSGGLVDSGSTVRALLSLKPEDRRALARYQGPAILVHLRSICFAPQFDTSTASMSNTSVPNVTFSGQLSNMALGSYHRKLLERTSVTFNSSEAVYFEPIGNCTIIAGDISLCDLQLVAQDSAGGTGGYGGFPSKTLSKIDWVLVSNLSFPDYPLSSSPFTSLPPGASVKLQPNSSSYDGTEWTTQAFPAISVEGHGIHIPKIEHSLCTFLYQAATGDILADAKTNYSEPGLSSLWNRDAKYITTDIQIQLGVDAPGPLKKSPKERGIFSLASFSRNNDAPVVRMSWGRGFGTIHKTLPGTVPGDIFTNTLRDTKQLSSAWDAAAMTLVSSHHSFHLNFYDLPGNASMYFFRPYSIPKQYLGFQIVMVFIGFHFVLLCVILGVYFQSETFKVELLCHGGPYTHATRAVVIIVKLESE